MFAWQTQSGSICAWHLSEKVACMQSLVEEGKIHTFLEAAADEAAERGKPMLHYQRVGRHIVLAIGPQAVDDLLKGAKFMPKPTFIMRMFTFLARS